MEIKILSVEVCDDRDYGKSIVKYAIGDNFISYIFSDEDVNDYSETSIIEEIKQHLIEHNGIENFPLWTDLSKTLLDEIIESCWDMRFIEYDDEDWDEFKSNKIIEESLQWCSLDNVVEYGEDNYITIFAGAMNCVNWYGNEVYGDVYSSRQDVLNMLDIIEDKSDRYPQFTKDRLVELLTLAIDGLLEDDEESAREYFRESMEMSEEEAEFFGIDNLYDGEY